MQIDHSSIKNIIFDLGNVLLNLDFEASIQAFQKLGLDAKVIDKKQAYSDPVFYELETGKISAAGFRNRIREIIHNPGATDQEIDNAWSAMILDIPPDRVQTIQKLTKNFNIYLFSNTNEIHINKLHKQFKSQHGIEFPSLFIKDYYSHEIHDRKPDLNSYKKVIELSGVVPNESLFVDDLEKNIKGAEEAGLKTFWLKPEMEMSEVF